MPAGNFTEPGCVLLIRWLGGIETPRLNVTRGPHAPPRRRGGRLLRLKSYANASRHYPAVAVHVVGSQAAFFSYDVWHCLKSKLSAASGEPEKKIPQQTGKATGHPGTKHHVYVSWTDCGRRGQHPIWTDLLLHLQRLPRDSRRSAVCRR